MATENQTFPFLSAHIWWALRKKFNTTIPKEVSANYIATAFDMGENSAKANVISKLRQIGFIDETGKPTELVKQWRDDDQYSLVCKQIIDKYYPSDLIEAIDEPLKETEKVIKWFKNKTGHGEAAATKMARFYLLLVEADYSKQNESLQGKSEKSKTNNSSTPKKNIEKKDKLSERTAQVSERTAQVTIPNTHDSITKSPFKPSVHIDIQIHISPESSPEQIDKIFESMAKHLSGAKMQ